MINVCSCRFTYIRKANWGLLILYPVSFLSPPAVFPHSGCPLWYSDSDPPIVSSLLPLPHTPQVFSTLSPPPPAVFPHSGCPLWYSDFFWEAEEYETLYRRVHRYLDVEDRLTVRTIYITRLYTGGCTATSTSKTA